MTLSRIPPLPQSVGPCCSPPDTVDLVNGRASAAIGLRGRLSKRQVALLIGSVVVGSALVVLASSLGADAASISLEIGAAIALAGIILVFERMWAGKVQAELARESERVDDLEREAILHQVERQGLPTSAGSDLSGGGNQPIKDGWFASFTASLRPVGADDFDYYTAYGEIVDVIPETEDVGESVRVKWRDELDLPAEVPLWLLQERWVRRLNPDGSFVRVQNDGLRTPGVGALVVGPGWAVHQSAPHRIVRQRASALDDRSRLEFEALAKPSLYSPASS